MHDLRVPGIVGLMCAGLLAAALSTLDGGINSIASVLTFDVLNRSETSVRASRLLTTLIGVGVIGAALLAPYIGKNFIDQITAVASTFLGLLLGVYVLGMSSRRANTGGAAIGLAAGAVGIALVHLHPGIPTWWSGAFAFSRPCWSDGWRAGSSRRRRRISNAGCSFKAGTQKNHQLTKEPSVKIERRKPLTAKVGIVGVGHHTYWAQFEGLLDEMHRKLEVFDGKVKTHGVETVCFGLLDNAETAYAALPAMQAADLDLLFIDMVTYATSSTFGILVRDLNVPIVLVALQRCAMPCETARTYIQLCNDDFCSVPDTGVAIRMGRPVADVILGVRGTTRSPTANRALVPDCKVLHDCGVRASG